MKLAINNTRFQESKYSHVYWADLNGAGIIQEVVVIAAAPNGTVWFIPVSCLDHIDRIRMFRLINDRTSNMLPLYEVMMHTRLNNGVNALEYFHQLTKMMTPNGLVTRVNTNIMGIQQIQQLQPQQPPSQPQQYAQQM